MPAVTGVDASAPAAEGMQADRLESAHKQEINAERKHSTERDMEIPPPACHYRSILLRRCAIGSPKREPPAVRDIVSLTGCPISPILSATILTRLARLGRASGFPVPISSFLCAVPRLSNVVFSGGYPPRSNLVPTFCRAAFNPSASPAKTSRGSLASPRRPACSTSAFQQCSPVQQASITASRSTLPSLATPTSTST